MEKTNYDASSGKGIDMSEDLTRNLPTSFQERVLAELTAIRQENAQTTARLTSLEGRMTAFEDRLVTLEGSMTSLEGRLTSIEDRITSLEGRMTSLEGRMTSLGDHVLSIDTRLTSLEEKVDARLRETRPIWEAVQQCLTGVEAELNNLNRQVRALLADIFQMRVRVDRLEDNQQPL